MANQTRSKSSSCDPSVKSEPAKSEKSDLKQVKVRTKENIESKIIKAENAKARIYAKGLCPGCAGPGVAACVIVEGTNIKEVVRHFVGTTVNRMELLAVILGLEELASVEEIIVISRAKYVTDAFNKGWLQKWKANGWNLSATKELANRDLWMRLDELVSGRIVQFEWAGEILSTHMVRAEGLAVAEHANQRLGLVINIIEKQSAWSSRN